jgi:pyruvate dehydrogenase E2 component (dihydrolipoamide acetyltransferase)
MPKLGMTMKEGKLSKWFKNEGEEVAKGELLFEVETEKITNQVESTASGVLFQIVVSAGQTVPVGTILAVIAEAGETPERIEGIQAGEIVEAGASDTAAQQPSAEAEEGPPQRVSATPAAKRLAKELGVDISRVRGGGPGGKIKEEDVRKFHEAGPTAPKITPVAAEIAREKGLDITQLTGTGEGGKITKADVTRALEPAPEAAPETAPKVVPLAGMRKVIADNMHFSLQNAAQLSTFTETDVTETVRFRDLVREKYQKDGVKISINDIVIMATVRTLLRHPVMNTTLENEEIHFHDTVHMGIAVALGEGLIVPKLRSAEKKTLLEIAAESRDLADRARKGTLAMDEVTGGTFTITNVSMLGMDGFTPVLNPPETGILGIGRVVDKPVVRNGEIEIRKMTTLSLTFDHRVVDGAPAMMFLRDLASCLTEPMMMLV